MPLRSFATRLAVPVTLWTVAFTGFASLPARADVTHVVGRGQTIEAIANRYHVAQKAILDANKLKDSKHLKPGDTLIIPGVTAKPPAPAKTSLPSAKDEQSKADKKDKDGATKKPGGDKADKKDAAKPGKGEGDRAAGPATAADKKHGGVTTTASASHKGETPNTIAPRPRAPGADKYEDKPKQPDVVHAMRFGEEFLIRTKDRHGKIPPPALKTFEKMMRSGSVVHAVDPRLVALVGMVSKHFGGRKLEIVSGFRPFTPTQYTPHSNHNFGRALDFRVVGVPNEVLRDFCKGLRNVGVGYYPNSTFVHLDVREAPAFWVDYSRPGEAPKYDKPGQNPDEGAGDVPDDKPVLVPEPAAAIVPAPAPTPASTTAPATPPTPGAGGTQ
jgi:uncharacterized protein YcbK (DUF882 family)